MVVAPHRNGQVSYIFMPQMLQELKFSVGSLGQHRGAERLHDFLDSNGLAGKLIFGGAVILIRQ